MKSPDQIQELTPGVYTRQRKQLEHWYRVVRGNHIPKWLNDACRKAHGRTFKTMTIHKTPRWLDHWGSMEKGARFIVEPYSLPVHVMKDLIAFLDAMDVDWRITGEALWHPMALRIEITPPVRWPTEEEMDKEVDELLELLAGDEVDRLITRLEEAED